MAFGRVQEVRVPLRDCNAPQDAEIPVDLMDRLGASGFETRRLVFSFPLCLSRAAIALLLFLSELGDTSLAQRGGSRQPT